MCLLQTLQLVIQELMVSTSLFQFLQCVNGGNAVVYVDGNEIKVLMIIDRS